MKSLSVIIPALNKEDYIGKTLQRINQAIVILHEQSPDLSLQVIVVDNDSTDQTAQIARSYGAVVVAESIRNISLARNAGARTAKGEILLFIDADTLIPETLLMKIASVMSDTSCVGGAVDTDHRPKSAILRIYNWFFSILLRLCGTTQGAAQFYRRDMFLTVGGYDENIYMGKDVDCYLRIARAARKTGSKIHFISDMKVIPSPRRYDSWPLWKTFLWTSPLLVTLMRRRKSVWAGWYKDVPR